MAKETFQFCPNAKCAKLTIKIGDERPIILLSKAPTLTLEIDGRETEIYRHEMDSPIRKEFESEIVDIENIDGYWYYNSADLARTKVDCPMPGTYPVLVSSEFLPENDPTKFNRNQITDLYWENNKLICYHSLTNPDGFFNNVGTCTYRVYFNRGTYKFFDRQGVLYQNRPDAILKYKVECDACCKDDEILCDSNHFPGYSCYPIPPINTKLAENKNNIARFWR